MMTSAATEARPAAPRSCGDCTLCCRLLPIAEIGKLAGVRCEAQCSKGCRVYASPNMPASCRLWSCAWRLGDPTGQRPDRAHAVVDMMPDYVTVTVAGQRDEWPVLQVWMDPRHPDAHRAPQLRAYLAQVAATKGMAALVRYDNRDAFLLIPPAMAPDGKWHEVRTNFQREKEHSLADKLRVMAAHDNRNSGDH